MSIHTIIESNIHNLDDLMQILESQGISWTRAPITLKGSNEKAFCGVAAWINGEFVLIYQHHSGEPFVFQSEEYFFRNKSSTEALALNGMEMATRKKREKEEEKTRRHEAEEKRQEEAKQHQKLAEEKQRRKLVEEERLRKLEEEQEEQRLQELQQQAADVLQRLEAKKAAKQQERQKQNKPTVSPSPSQGGGSSSSSASLESVIGKFHQQNALRKILDSLEALEQDTGLSLYSQETLEYETIELTLRG